jgi:rod shape-determining protein MreC
MTTPLGTAPRWRPSRRSSFARRDSNLALLGAVLAGAILAFALLLLLIQKANPEQGTRIRGAAADLVQPVSALLATPARVGRAVVQAVSDHWRVVGKNRALEAEVLSLEEKAARSDALALEVRRLDALLKLQRPERRVVATGQAAAQAGTASSRMALVSVGLRDGVRPQMPVIAADGLAGRIVDVGHHASRMMLLTDANSRVPAKVLRTGWTGLAVGRGTTTLDFQFDPASGADRIRAGDRLVTSGDGGLYPPGIPVAVVIDATTSPPRLRPAANPAGLGPIMVEAPWLPPPAILPVPAAAPEPDRPSEPGSSTPPDGPAAEASAASRAAAAPAP